VTGRYIAFAGYTFLFYFIYKVKDMAGKKKVFVIEINGVKEIKEVCENIILLKDSLSDLEEITTKSKTGDALASIFGKAGSGLSFLKEFGQLIALLAENTKKMGEIVKGVEALQKSMPAGKKEDEKKKASDPEIDSFTSSLKTSIKEFAQAFIKEINDLKTDAEKFSDALKELFGVGSKGESKKNEFKLDEIALDDKFKIEKVTDRDGFTDVEATRAKIKVNQQVLDDYMAKLGEAEKMVKAYFEAELEKYADNAEKKEALLLAQQGIEDQINVKKQEGNKKQEELDKLSYGVRSKLLAEFNERAKKLWDALVPELDKMQKTLTSGIDMNIKKITAEITEVSKKYDEIVKKHKETQAKIDALNKESLTASGGRAIVIEEQLARQMEANQQLAMQEKELSDKKKALEKEKSAEEKKKQRIELINKIVQAGANVAFGVTQALTLPFGLNFMIAAMVSAMGGAQVLLMSRQLSKLEDGGLLRGKRHRYGGMRIEGTNIEVEGGEYVVNRASTGKNIGLLDYINRTRRELSPADINKFYSHTVQADTTGNSFKRIYEEGGVLTNLETVGNAASATIDERVIEAIGRINFRPVVSVVDIVNAQNSVARVKDIAGA